MRGVTAAMRAARDATADAEVGTKIMIAVNADAIGAPMMIQLPLEMRPWRARNTP
jgi:hypothetical protein